MCTPFVPVLSQTNPLHFLAAYFCTMHFNILLPPQLSSPTRSYPSGLPTKTLREYLCSPLRVTCPVHLTVLDLITVVMAVQNTSWSSSFCGLQSFVPCSLLDRIIYVKLTRSKIFELRTHDLPLMWKTKINTHIKQRVTLWFTLLHTKREYKRFWTEYPYEIPTGHLLLLISSSMEFPHVSVLPKQTKFATFCGKG